MKYNRYEDIEKLIEFIDIDYTLINIYKEIEKIFRKRIVDKKKHMNNWLNILRINYILGISQNMQKAYSI
jgi:hypothetical protein